MLDHKSFVKHLTNLKNQGKKAITVDIDFLLRILSPPVTQETPPPKPQMPPNRVVKEWDTKPKIIKIDVDGGSF
jgi:hypothetical protein